MPCTNEPFDDALQYLGVNPGAGNRPRRVPRPRRGADRSELTDGGEAAGLASGGGEDRGSEADEVLVGRNAMSISAHRPQRIVNNVDALTAFCDQLEDRLRAAQDTSAAFATAAVHHLNA